jgi:hypothetical protein
MPDTSTNDMMRTPGPADRPPVFGDWPGQRLEPDPDMGGQVMVGAPAPPMSWGLQNPTLPSQLSGWLRNYYGGVGSIHQDVLDALVLSARQGNWDAGSGDFGHGNAGLPDSGANLPPDQAALGASLSGVGSGPKRFGGSNDLSEPQPTYLGVPSSGTPGGPWSRQVLPGT